MPRLHGRGREMRTRLELDFPYQAQPRVVASGMMRTTEKGPPFIAGRVHG
jgi:hypothetical protein